MEKPAELLTCLHASNAFRTHYSPKLGTLFRDYVAEKAVGIVMRVCQKAGMVQKNPSAVPPYIWGHRIDRGMCNIEGIPSENQAFIELSSTKSGIS